MVVAGRTDRLAAFAQHFVVGDAIISGLLIGRRIELATYGRIARGGIADASSQMMHGWITSMKESPRWA
ncbi:hypothetical protein LR032_00190, partial [Candidatus Bipolaricaulota bacterium]|nr:hypothetical protein [Candidatus Bipolaricaulota bacterium]